MQLPHLLLVIGGFLAHLNAESLSNEERLILVLTNGFRMHHKRFMENYFNGEKPACKDELQPNLQPLYSLDSLVTAARKHNNDMLQDQSCWRHESCDNKSEESGERIRRISGIDFQATGENIAFRPKGGKNDAVELVLQWIKSEGHCKTMARDHYTHIGVAYGENSKRRYGTQDFAKTEPASNKIIGAAFHPAAGKIIVATRPTNLVKCIINGEDRDMEKSVDSQMAQLYELNVNGFSMDTCNKYYIQVDDETLPKTGSYVFGKCSESSESSGRIEPQKQQAPAPTPSPEQSQPPAPIPVPAPTPTPSSTSKPESELLTLINTAVIELPTEPIVISASAQPSKQAEAQPNNNKTKQDEVPIISIKSNENAVSTSLIRSSSSSTSANIASSVLAAVLLFWN